MKRAAGVCLSLNVTIKWHQTGVYIASNICVHQKNPPEFAAQMATHIEHIFPILLVPELFTRLSALGSADRALVIQISV